MDKRKTKVIFRQYPNGEIIALFPDLPGTNDPSTCESYMHVGQHSSAHYAGVIRSTVAVEHVYATAFKEALPLLRELIARGYNLDVKTRDARAAMYNKRLAALGTRSARGSNKVVSCPDCGEEGERKGHMGCQYPSDTPNG